MGVETAGRRCPGYLSLYLALSLPLVLSVFGVFFYGALQSAVQLKAELSFDASVIACLAESHRELLSRYDLFLVDTSYQTPFGSTLQTAGHLRDWMARNVEEGLFGPKDRFFVLEAGDVSITQWRYATDAGGEAVREQIGAYMETDPAGTVITAAAGLAAQYEGLPAGPSSFGGTLSRITDSLLSLSGEEGEEASGGDGALEITEKLKRFLASPVLSLVQPEGVGEKHVNPEDLPSRRLLRKGTGIRPAKERDTASMPVMDLYLFEKCGWFGPAMETAALDCQLEYILCGKESDAENLEAVAKRILLLRLAANSVVISGDPEKVLAAEEAAVGLSAVTLTPHLLPLYREAFLLAWGLAESLVDVRTLLRGGKVPAVKTAGEWETDVSLVLDLLQGKGLGEVKVSSRGLPYAAYLEMLLFLENAEQKTMRFLDVVETEIRRTPGNGSFRMDACLDVFAAEAKVLWGKRVITLRGRAEYG